MINLEIGTVLTCNEHLEMFAGRQAVVTNIKGEEVTFKIAFANFNCNRKDVPYYFTTEVITFLEQATIEYFLENKEVIEIQKTIELNDNIEVCGEFLEIEELKDILKHEELICWLESVERGYILYIQDFREFIEETHESLMDEYRINIA